MQLGKELAADTPPVDKENPANETKRRKLSLGAKRGLASGLANPEPSAHQQHHSPAAVKPSAAEIPGGKAAPEGFVDMRMARLKAGAGAQTTYAQPGGAFYSLCPSPARCSNAHAEVLMCLAA